MVCMLFCRALYTRLTLNSTQYNTSSLLLRQPQEIKNMIYGWVIGREAIHIDRRYSGAHSRISYECYICKAKVPDINDSKLFDVDEVANMTPQEKSDRVWDERHIPCCLENIDICWKVPAVLLACRQTYLEARMIIYKDFTLQFDSTVGFHCWTKSLSPAKVAAVQSIRLTDERGELPEWVSMIGFMLGRLAGLRSIELQLYRDYYSSDEEIFKYIEDFGEIELGAVTLNVLLSSRQIASFHGTPKGGAVRSIRASDLWS